MRSKEDPKRDIKTFLVRGNRENLSKLSAVEGGRMVAEKGSREKNMRDREG